jgi:hypothetical protein
MKPTKTESITVIMPCDKITQLKARAAKLGCTPDELAVRALARAKARFYEKNKKDTAFSPGRIESQRDLRCPQSR